MHFYFVIPAFKVYCKGYQREMYRSSMVARKRSRNGSNNDFIDRMFFPWFFCNKIFIPISEFLFCLIWRLHINNYSPPFPSFISMFALTTLPNVLLCKTLSQFCADSLSKKKSKLFILTSILITHYNYLCNSAILWNDPALATISWGILSHHRFPPLGSWVRKGGSSACFQQWDEPWTKEGT